MTPSAILCGDSLALLHTLPSDSLDSCVTSPPYWGQRDYGVEGQLGLERYPELYVGRLVDVFREVRRVLKPSGTLWLVLGDCYATGAGKCKKPGGGREGAAWVGDRGESGNTFHYKTKRGPGCPPNRLPLPGLKPKDLIGVPWMVAFALRADGWYLRQEIIWHKPNCRYESVHDRPTTAHEHVFLLSKSERYRYDAAAIEEPAAEYERRRRQLEAKRGLNSTYRIKRDVPHGQNPPGRTSAGRSAAARQKLAAKGTRNARSVWSIPLTPSKVEHMAMFPRALAERCILAGCPDGGIVLDPFFGAGTTGLAAVQLGRRYLGIDLNPEYCRIARARISAARPIRPIRQIGPTHD